LFGSLFGKRKKKRVDPNTLVDSIVDARPGDVLTVSGYDLDLENAYFVIEQLNRYESGPSVWYEVLGLEGDKKLWLNWSSEGGLHVSASANRRPMGLRSVGLTETDLERLDQEHSIDNYISYDGLAFYYLNSGEAFCFENNIGTGEGFYLWDFTSEDETRSLSIDKWEAMPYQAYASDVILADSVTVYKR